MSDERFYLTGEDKAILRELIAAHRARRNRNRFRRRERQVFPYRPFELTSDFTQDETDGEWTATAKRVTLQEEASESDTDVYLVDDEADEITLYAPITPHDGDDGPPPPPFREGERVYAVNRGRWEIVDEDYLWMPGKNFDPSDSIPAHGICDVKSISVTETTRVPQLGILPPYETSGYDFPPDRPFAVNGINAVNGQYTFGRVSYATGVPVLALYDTDAGTPALGETWGPYGDDFKLYPGLPGFRVVGNYDSGDGLVWVISDYAGGSYWCKAIADPSGSSPRTVSVRPMTGRNGSVYDGTGDYPAISFDLTMPAVPDQFDWNIHEDDEFAYHCISEGGGQTPVPDSMMLDAPMGTLRFHNNSSIPPGWSLIGNATSIVAHYDGSNSLSLSQGTGAAVNVVQYRMIVRDSGN